MNSSSIKGVYLAAAAMALESLGTYKGMDFGEDSHPGPHLKGKSSLGKGSVIPVPDKKFKGTGRNELCPCDSNLKYKKCCGR